MLKQTLIEHAGKLTITAFVAVVGWLVDIRRDVDGLETNREVVVEKLDRINEKLNDHTIKLNDIADDLENLPPGEGLRPADLNLLRETLDTIRRRNCFDSGGRPGQDTPLCRGL